MEGITTWVFAVLAACLVLGASSYPQAGHDHHHHDHDHDHDHNHGTFDPSLNDTEVSSVNDLLPKVPGKAIEIDQASFMTSVHNDGRFLCAGVILNKLWVLASDIDLSNIKANTTSVLVRTGHSHRDHDGIVYKIVSILVKGKLALLKTEKPITLINGNTGTIDVATAEHPYAADKTAQVIGWGHPGREDRVGGKHTHLHALDVTVLSDKTCSDTFGPSYDSKALICASGHNGCTGSSPLIQKPYVIGFVSDAVGCGESDLPMTYIDVVPLSGWILEHIKS